MKLALIIIVTTLSQSITFAAVKSYHCRNEARSPVTATVAVSAKTLEIKFGSGSDGGNLENDFKNKSATLKFDPEASQFGWRGYTADILVNPTFSDYRTVEVRFETTSLGKKSPIEMKFALSEIHSKTQPPMIDYAYGMICE